MHDRNDADATPTAPLDPTADEALQRARTTMTTETRTLMAVIGLTLTQVRPTLVMREVTRLAYAGRAAADIYGSGTHRAVAATGLLLRHMPRLDWPTAEPITRAQYGEQLIRKAKAPADISPARAAAMYLHRQEAALQGRRPSTGETRTQLGSARTAGNAAATTR
ncbi:hypothetical protein [Streptomyces microflavus]|uniref:hypothetical protein n=1 Tax=Streptomyces microflavus TaxID=1919 RepID=UPI002E2F38BA|nr:hypothetical protein [Streptomyces microflavus]